VRAEFTESSSAAPTVRVVIDLVLPVLDEREALPWVLGRLPGDVRAIVVDNGSRDGSGELAAQLGATVVLEPVPGYGAACHRGLQAASADIVCFMDADGSLDPRDLPLVLEPVLAGRAQLALGARRAAGRGAYPLRARLVNRLLAAEVRRRTGAAVTDIGPMRAARRRDLLDLGIADRRFGYPLETVLRAASRGWTIAEVRVPYRPRAGGRSKVTGNLRGSLRAVRDMAEALT
jgi:glycosyltransferase involved in cell wall biosynthesis